MPGRGDTPPPLTNPVGADPEEPAERAWTETTGLHELVQPRPEVLGEPIADWLVGLLLN